MKIAKKQLKKGKSPYTNLKDIQLGKPLGDRGRITLMLTTPSVRPSVNLGELTHNTLVKQTWQMSRRISGKRKDKTIKYLVTDSDTITNKTEIADTLATSFAEKSSPDHYQEKE